MKRIHNVRTVSEKDVALAVEVLQGKVSLAKLRQVLGLSCTSCYSYTFRCLRKGIIEGTIAIRSKGSK